MGNYPDDDPCMGGDDDPYMGDDDDPYMGGDPAVLHSLNSYTYR